MSMRGGGRGGQWRVKSSDEEEPLPAGSAQSAQIQPPTTTPAQQYQPQPTSTHSKQIKSEDTTKRHHNEKGPRDKKAPRDEGKRRRDNNNNNKSNEVDSNSKSMSDAERIKAEEEKKKKQEEDQKRKEEELKQELEKKQKEEEAKKEEDRKREEERLRLEAETQMKQEEARKKLMEAKHRLRAENLQVTLSPDKRSSAAFLKTLDANVKRNTAFIKKLKSLTHDNAESICTELAQLNLSRYVTEAVTNIAEANLKPTDVDAAVKVCSLLHQRYAEFSPNLIPTLAKHFTKPQQQETEQEKNQRYAKRRTTLKFLTELLLVGVYTDPAVLLNVLKQIVNEDKEYNKDKEYALHLLALIVSFVRHAESELLGLKLRKRIDPTAGPEAQEEEVDNKGEDARNPVITPEQQAAFLKLLEGYYNSMAGHLVAEHTTLRERERENHTALLTKGEITEAASSAYDTQRKFYEKLHGSIVSLSGLLGQDMPVLPEDQNTTRILIADPIAAKVLNKDEVREYSIWDDDDTRSFYENLPDLALFVPKVLLTDSGHKEEIKEEKDKEKEKDEEEKEKKTDEKEEEDKESGRDGKDDTKHGGSGIDAILQRLPNCVNRDLIDQLAVSFCYVNSKTNRKKIIKAMFNVPRTQLVLLPYYARLTAILSQYMKDVGSTLVAMLEEEFSYLFNKKDQMNIETKVKNIRFLGELVKFKICPTAMIFNFLKMCLDDFAHHNIDVACNLLETCGRFLYRTPETHIRVQNMLETLMRLKNAKNLDNRQETMVENAYYQCKPPERSARSKSKENKDPLQLYTKYLIYSQLNKNTAKVVLKQLRKLPWDKMEDYIEECLRKVHKGKFGNIHLVASIISGLSAYYDTLAVKLVDALLEDIQLGLEKNDFTMHQRRVMQVKLLGELYNYCIFESAVVFDCLYSIISLGHPNGVPTPAPVVDDEEGHNKTASGTGPNTLYGSNARIVSIDPPTDCFRIRLICVLLDTCGQFFDRGSAKKKLDDFLLYFQRYILSKSQLPVDVEFMISDTFEALRPKLNRLQNYDTCHEEIQKLEAQASVAQAQPASQSQIPRNVSSSSKKKEKDDDHESESESDRDAESDDEYHDEGNDEADGGEGNIETDGSEDEDDDEDEDEEEKKDYDKKEEDDHVTFGRSVKFPKATTVQDDEFDRELNKFVHEGMEAQRKARSQKPLELKLPMSLINQTKTSESEKSASGSDDEEASRSKDSIKFAVLLRPKGKKELIKNIEIPVDSSFARQTQTKKEEEKQEQQVLKRIVLQYEQQVEDESIEEDFPELTIRKDRPQRGGATGGFAGTQSYRGRGGVKVNIAQRGRGHNVGHYAPQHPGQGAPAPPTHPNLYHPQQYDNSRR